MHAGLANKCRQHLKDVAEKIATEAGEDGQLQSKKPRLTRGRESHGDPPLPVVQYNENLDPLLRKDLAVCIGTWPFLAVGRDVDSKALRFPEDAPWYYDGRIGWYLLAVGSACVSGNSSQ